MKGFEYAISHGEGTLIEHGITDDANIAELTDICLSKGYTLIFEPAASGCVTGL